MYDIAISMIHMIHMIRMIRTIRTISAISPDFSTKESPKFLFYTVVPVVSGYFRPF